MSLVNLVSGGLDSTLIGVMAAESGVTTYPLFIDYGQLAANQEWEACKLVHDRYNLPKPRRVDISGFGKLVQSGLTSANVDIEQKAFTPGRNMLFLLLGSSYGLQSGVNKVAIGLLSEEYSLFPDQSSKFIEDTETAIESALGSRIQIITPLSAYSGAT